MTTVKQYPWKFKLCYKGELGVEYYQTKKTLGSDWYAYYFKVGLMDKKMRKACIKFSEDDGWMRKIWGWPNFGLHKFWHDCPHGQLNLYFIVFYWSTQWTNMPKDY
jgi:hypothetical protein